MAHLHERKEGLDGCEGSEDVDVEDALELGQISALQWQGWASTDAGCVVSSDHAQRCGDMPSTCRI